MKFGQLPRETESDPPGEIRRQTGTIDARSLGSFTARHTVIMTNSLRSAMAFCAALAISGVAPAQAGKGDAGAQLIATANLPKVATPDLLAGEDEPQLTGDSPVESPLTQTFDATGDEPHY